MKTQKTTAAHFELQKTIEEVFFNYKVLALHQRTDFYLMDDLVSHLCVKGLSRPLQQLLHHVFEHTLLLSGATRVSLTTKQLLQTQSDVLIEFCLEDDGPNLRNNVSRFTYYRGLATAKQMIADMKGKSEVMSVPGISTTVKFVVRYELYNTKEAASAYPCSQLKDKRILIAEDNEANQKAVAGILARHGIAFDIANHGKDAIELFEKNRDNYDLVIMDLQMPFMDGIQATNYIRKKLKSDVPVIALTAGDPALTQAECVEVGINQYINKPFKAQELMEQIQYALHDQQVIEPRAFQNCFTTKDQKAYSFQNQ